MKDNKDWITKVNEEMARRREERLAREEDPDLKISARGKAGGSTTGKMNVLNGHWRKLAIIGNRALTKEQRKKGAENQSKEDKIRGAKISSNALYLFNEGSILKNIAAKNEFLKKNPTLYVTEVIYPEDPRYNEMLKIRDEQDLKRRTCEYCNKPFHRKRIDLHRSHCRRKPV